jgi:CheY-like chemotaxis protein
MIYFVDEDVSQIGSWDTMLRVRGHQTSILRNAELAYEKLTSCQDAELVFIDVMLAGAPDPDKRRFLSENTDHFLSTGLELLKDLNLSCPAIFPTRAVLLSHTGKPTILAKIEKICQEFKVPFWRKRSFGDLHDFATKADGYLLTIRGKGKGAL